MIYKIAEYFDSIQGEASYAGARMFFIRLAGCNVGKYIEPEFDDLKTLRVLHPKHSVCTSALGNSFLCDTDYHAAETFTEEQLISLAAPQSPIVCITGGEPFLWELTPLVEALWKIGKKVHIETSGTLPFKSGCDWLTCSPKANFLPANLSLVDEWKFVVDKSMGQPVEVAKKILEFVKYAQNKRVFIQPANDIEVIDKENLEYALAVMKCTNSPWRLSIQAHKLLKMR